MVVFNERARVEDSIRDARIKVYEQLRAHPKGPKRITEIARNIVTEDGSPLTQVTTAQRLVVDYAIAYHNADADVLLQLYSERRITNADFINFHSRWMLGLQI